MAVRSPYPRNRWSCTCRHGLAYYQCKQGCWEPHADMIHKLSHWQAAWLRDKQAWLATQRTNEPGQQRG